MKVWIYFTDKDTAGFRISDHFDATVIERRKIQQLPAWDLYDVPVTTRYVNAVTSYCDSVLVVSRWLNGMAVWTNPVQLPDIEQFSFVKSVEIISAFPEGGICQPTMDEVPDYNGMTEAQYKLAAGQTRHLQGKAFREAGFTGKGVRVAVIDAGFRGLSESKVLKHVRLNNRVLYTYDFLKKSTNVERGSKHGTAVLSCIAGKLDTIPLGLAPDAEFLLYRTEKVLNEKMNEEEYWLAAAEDAEKRGAQVINTSLGYTGRRYFRKDMDGHHSLLSKAATMAARKGISVVCSAGNEGTNFWRIVATPADSDSILAVGALNPWTGIQAAWSSVGPSADKRVKPNVCAYGFVMADDAHGSVAEVPGTSFSSPLTAGFVACVRQMHPEYSVMKMIDEVQKSGNLYPYYDYSHGYGVPQATYFTDSLRSEIQPTFYLRSQGDTLYVNINRDCFKPAYLTAPSYHSVWVPTLGEPENERPSYHVSEGMYTSSSSVIHMREPGYFYYALLNTAGYLDWYYVVSVSQPDVLKIHKKAIDGLGKLVLHYNGYTLTWPER